ncbi:MAG: hypothetical protein ACYC23_13130, partial [Limisphaerales bacterium]
LLDLPDQYPGVLPGRGTESGLIAAGLPASVGELKASKGGLAPLQFLRGNRGNALAMDRAAR